MLRSANKLRSFHRKVVLPPFASFADKGMPGNATSLPHPSERVHRYPCILSSLDRRTFSSSSDQSNPDGNVDDTLNKLFEDSQQLADNGEAWYAGAEKAVTDWVPTWYNLSDQAIVAVTNMHEFTGLEYGWSIVASTAALRIFLFPVMVASQRASSRMAHLQPELHAFKIRYEKLGSPTRQEQLQYGNQMKGLFAKYEVKPARAFVGPLLQLPLMVGMFLGLRKMPDIFPEALSNGGMYWFTDLTTPDPMYILPLYSVFTFLGMVEIGKQQMLAQTPGPQGEFLLNFFRFTCLMSLPFSIRFETAVLLYWSTNNTFSVAQALLLKAEPVKAYFGIWDPPKKKPGDDSGNMVKAMTNLAQRMQGNPVSDEQKIAQHNKTVDAKKASFRMARAARERRRKGITGTTNR